MEFGNDVTKLLPWKGRSKGIYERMGNQISKNLICKLNDALHIQLFIKDV